MYRAISSNSDSLSSDRWAVANWHPRSDWYVSAKNLLHSIGPQLLFTAKLSERSHQLGEKSKSRKRAVFVTNLKWPVTEEALRKHPEKFGEIRDLHGIN